MAEVIVIDLQLGQSVQKVNDLKKAIAELKASNDALKKSEGDNSKAITENEIAIRNKTKELRTLNSIIDNSIKINQAQKGSIEANRAELSKLTAEYIKLGKPTKEQTDKIKSLSETLKRQEKAIGDTRRNVGNYQEAIEKAAKGVNLFGVNLGDSIEKLKSTRETIKAVTVGVEGSAKAFNLLKLALIGLGIGALLVALGALTTFLSKSEKGIELVNKVTTILGATFDVVIKRIEQFATGVSFILKGDFSKGVDKLSGSFTGLAKEIGQAANQASKLADAQERLEDAEISFIKRRSEIRAAIQDQRDIANDENKTIQERQGALLKALDLQSELTNREKEIADLRLVNAQKEFELSAKTDTDRKKLEEAAAQAFEDERDRTKEKIKLENELNSLTNKQKSEQAKAAKELSDAQKKQIEQNEQLNKQLQDSLTSDFDLRKQKIEEDAEAYRKAGAAKADVDKFIAQEYAKLNEDITKKAIAEFNKRLAAQKQSANTEILAIQERYNQELLAAGDNKEEIKRIEDEKNKAVLEKTRQLLQDQLQLLNEQVNPLLADAEGGLILKSLGLDPENEAVLKEKIQEVRTQLSELNLSIAAVGTNADGEPQDLLSMLGLTEDGIDNFTTGIEFISSSLGQISELVNRASSQRIEGLEKEKEAALALAGDSASERERIENTYNAKIEKEKKKAFEKNKKLQIATATIQMLTSIISAFNTGMQAGFPAGPVLAGIFSGLAAGIGAANIALIAKEKYKKGGKIPKAEEGIVIPIGGKSHAQGGTQIALDGVPVAEAEKGEDLYVMKKTASEAIRNLSDWNQKFGGNSWTQRGSHLALGGGINDGGFSARDISSSALNNLQIADAVSGVIAQMPTPIVKVSEINRVQRSGQQTVEVSGL